MRVIINDIEKDVPDNISVTDLFILTGIDPEQVVIEHNGMVISPENYTQTTLINNDKIELIQFVGGG